jgi:hypothetical protein
MTVLILETSECVGPACVPRGKLGWFVVKSFGGGGNDSNDCSFYSKNNKFYKYLLTFSKMYHTEIEFGVLL